MADFNLSPEELQTLATEAGFALAGIAAAPPPDVARSAPTYYDAWVEQGRAGEMEYLKRRDDAGRLLRSELHTAFPWAESVIVCAVNYNAEAPRSIDPAPETSGWIARYAWSGRRDETGCALRPSDYHDVLLPRLRSLEAKLKERLGPFESRVYVDTGPLVERVYAKRAGIGWVGKNTCILHQQLGSWLLLGVIVTSLRVAPDSTIQAAADRCGTCRRCIDACPTGALVGPRAMDASLCISYLTIEKRGAIPEALRAPMGRQIFGCDICQDVCPWNRKAPAAHDAEMEARTELVNPALAWLAGLDAQEFNRLFRGSPGQAREAGGHAPEHCDRDGQQRKRRLSAQARGVGDGRGRCAGRDGRVGYRRDPARPRRSIVVRQSKASARTRSNCGQEAKMRTNENGLPASGRPFGSCCVMARRCARRLPR